MTLTAKSPVTDTNPNKNILVYKQGVSDAKDYSSLP